MPKPLHLLMHVTLGLILILTCLILVISGTNSLLVVEGLCVVPYGRVMVRLWRCLGALNTSQAISSPPSYF